MRWLGWMVLVGGCTSSSSAPSGATADTGVDTLSASDVLGGWSGTCVATSGATWAMELDVTEGATAELDVAYTWEWVDGTSPIGEGVAMGTLDGQAFLVSASVVPYTTGYTIDVDLDLALELVDGRLEGEASFVDDATCTFDRR